MKVFFATWVQTPAWGPPEIHSGIVVATSLERAVELTGLDESDLEEIPTDAEYQRQIN